MTISSSFNNGLTAFGPGGQGLATDAKSIDSLRSLASKDPKAAVKETAKQFESLFMKEIMKSMRQASLSSGFLENSGSQMGTEMLDSQYATLLSGMKGGLSEAITRQLERQMGGQQHSDTPPTIAPLNPDPIYRPLGPESQGMSGAQSRAATVNSVSAQTTSASGRPMTATQHKQIDFLRQHGDAARSASAETGIPSTFMLAQAAHESGWGRREIKTADGNSSFNVFGIKAGPGWTGKVAEVTTTEYVGGQPQKTVARFRAYDSYEEAFKDYASMIKSSPRYAQVVAQSSSAEGFAHGLQKAGYATDPAYADKLARVIQTTQRLQRSIT